jgi:hypothetical protein
MNLLTAIRWLLTHLFINLLICIVPCDKQGWKLVGALGEWLDENEQQRASTSKA